MATGSLSRSDLNQIYHVVQNTQESVAKDIFISFIKDAYKKDSYYHFVEDEFGFPKVIDLTGVPLEAGVADDVTTRIFIGEKFRHDAVFYPQILVSSGGVKDWNLSINMERETIKYEAIRVVDGYGNEKDYIIPSAYVFAGGWDTSIVLDVATRDIHSRDEICAFLMLLFKNIVYYDLLKAGIIVKGISSSGPSEAQDRQQNPLYKKSITIDIRTEWRRELPISDIIDAIAICIEIGDTTTQEYAPNLEINTMITLEEVIDSL